MDWINLFRGNPLNKHPLVSPAYIGVGHGNADMDPVIGSTGQQWLLRLADYLALALSCKLPDCRCRLSINNDSL
jgi:hypothetical protein